jgi:hypothetical protein
MAARPVGRLRHRAYSTSITRGFMRLKRLDSVYCISVLVSQCFSINLKYYMMCSV